MPVLAAVGVALGAAAGTTAAVVIGGAVVGAAVGALYSAVTGGDIIKGALFGAVGGAVIGGVGAAMGMAGAVTSSSGLGAAGAATTAETALAAEATAAGVGEGMASAYGSVAAEGAVGQSVGAGVMGQATAGMGASTAAAQAAAPTVAESFFSTNTLIGQGLSMGGAAITAGSKNSADEKRREDELSTIANWNTSLSTMGKYVSDRENTSKLTISDANKQRAEISKPIWASDIVPAIKAPTVAAQAVSAQPQTPAQGSVQSPAAGLMSMTPSLDATKKPEVKAPATLS